MKKGNKVLVDFSHVGSIMYEGILTGKIKKENYSGENDKQTMLEVDGVYGKDYVWISCISFDYNINDVKRSMYFVGGK